MVFAGIDPGQKGGIAIYDAKLLLAQAWPMPLHGKEPDVAAIMRLFASKCVAAIAIEEVGSMPGQGVASTFQFGTGYGMLLGAIAASQLPHHRVRPQAWKKVVLAGTAKDKAAAIAYCQRAHPTLQLVQPRARKPHDGMADAVCIAHWLARTLTGRDAGTLQALRVLLERQPGPPAGGEPC